MRRLIWLTNKHQSLRLNVLLRGAQIAPDKLLPDNQVCCIVLVAISSSGKATTVLTGTYVYPPFRFIVLFLLFFDYLGTATSYWWLSRLALSGHNGRFQLKRMSSRVYGLAAIMLSIAIVGAALDCWLLVLEVYLMVLYLSPLEIVLTYVAPIIHFHPLEYRPHH